MDSGEKIELYCNVCKYLYAHHGKEVEKSDNVFLCKHEGQIFSKWTNDWWIQSPDWCHMRGDRENFYFRKEQIIEDDIEWVAEKK